MRIKRILELFFSSNIVISGFISICIILSAFWFFLSKTGYSLEKINLLVDTIAKTFAVILGGVWFLNRYFTERKDIPKFEIQIDFNPIHLKSKKILLIYRLDFFNKSNILFDNYEYLLQIDGFSETEDKIVCAKLKRMPDLGHTIGLPIEPNSWSAINNELVLDEKIIALRFYYELKKAENIIFTWHKTYKI